VTNAEALIQGLQEVEDDEVVVFVADYINCPSSDDCKYDGKDNSPCCDCKVKWLRGNFEG